MRSEFEEMFIPAELHPDLKVYLTEGSHFKSLQHPLVYGVPYTPEMNNYYNKRYALLTESTQQALKDRKPFRYIWMHERPYRLDAFVRYTEEADMSDDDYWEALGAVWQDSENVWQHFATWKRLLRADRPNKHMFMDEEDREAFAKLPDTLKVYRGCVRDQNEKGMSWTLDRKRATWFSKRFQRAGEIPCVRSKTIRKDRVFAYLGGRGESEIIIV